MSERIPTDTRAYLGFKQEWQEGMGRPFRAFLVVGGAAALFEVGGGILAAEGGVGPALETATDLYAQKIAAFTPTIE